MTQLRWPGCWNRNGVGDAESLSSQDLGPGTWDMERLGEACQGPSLICRVSNVAMQMAR